MAAKDNDIGTWSDWSVAVHATPWTEEPKYLTTEAQAPGEGLGLTVQLREGAGRGRLGCRGLGTSSTRAQSRGMGP